MATDERTFRLPGRVDSYLAALNRLYAHSGESLLRELVVNGEVSIYEEYDYDNWNGGTFGHAVTLTVSEDLFRRAMDNQDEIQTRIASDMNKLDNSRNEHISRVFIEENPLDNDHWREQSGVYRPHHAALSISDEALRRIWGPQRVRVFLSHKVSIKEGASKLKQAFARCGMAAFVAHEDIEPTEEWQREIDRALFSMDALVALLTSDFHDSKWTDQEVGVAIGRGVLHIAVRLDIDPYGLMGKGQALRGCDLTDPIDIALKVFHLLYRRIAHNSRIFECALSAYAASESWDDSTWTIEHLLAVFESLSRSQVERVLNAYRTNKQNKNSFKGMDRLKPLLERWTNSPWHVVDNELVPLEKEVQSAELDEVPF